ncbi:hypothetical protein VTN77DRAFT_143 [Rasamsonia byssochlamydoides]|uniref:uncharacterized protein n=1 Tax=Rasamsonia byssochlamydoides TaxID=89139 RepID=UPI003742FBD8
MIREQRSSHGPASSQLHTHRHEISRKRNREKSQHSQRALCRAERWVGGCSQVDAVFCSGCNVITYDPAMQRGRCQLTSYLIDVRQEHWQEVEEENQSNGVQGGLSFSNIINLAFFSSSSGQPGQHGVDCLNSRRRWARGCVAERSCLRAGERLSSE